MPPAPKEPDEHVTWREFSHDTLPAVIKVKAGEGIMIPLPVKLADVEDAKAGSDNRAIVPGPTETKRAGV